MESMVERADEFRRPNDRDTGYKAKSERPYLDQNKGNPKSLSRNTLRPALFPSCMIIVVCIIGRALVCS